MKNENYYDEDNRVFIAYYDDKPYAVGYNKKYVKMYMERYRKLKPEEYVLMEDELDDNSLKKYADVMLYEFEGLYLPDRDIIMIGVFCHDIPERIRNLCRELYLFGGMIGQINGSGKDIDLILKTLHMLMSYYGKEKKLKKMQKVDHLDNPIIYCSIDEYKKHLHAFEEYNENHESFLNACWKSL